jgi:integrase
VRPVAVPSPFPTPSGPTLCFHLRDFVADDPDALIFTGAKGAMLRRSGFQTQSCWAQSIAQAGLIGFHFHDLRHTGNTLAADTGASLADLMARMVTARLARP